MPEPPLFPADPEQRAAVEEAERFGDEELQHPVRQILWWAIKHDKAPLRSYSEGAKIGMPIGLAMKTAAPIVALSARFNEADDANARAALAALPALLDRVDACIAAGTIGGEEPNAADFQIAPSLGLAMTMADLRPAIEGRPAAALAERIVPDYPGHTPPIFPAAWLDAAARARRRPSPASERAGAVDAFAVAERRQGVGEAGAVGQGQVGVELEQRHEDEAAARHLGVRQGEAVGLAARGRRAAAGRRRAGAGCGGGRRRSGRARPRSPCRLRAVPRARARCGSGRRR